MVNIFKDGWKINDRITIDGAYFFLISILITTLGALVLYPFHLLHPAGQYILKTFVPFIKTGNTGAGYFLMFAGGLLFAFSVTGRAEKSGVASAYPVRSEIIIFSVIMAAAVFMRLYEYAKMPYGVFGDETTVAMEAFKLANESFRKTSGANILFSGAAFTAPLNLLLETAFLKVLGMNIFGLRFANTFMSLLSVAAVYFMVRKMFGISAAVFAMLIMAFMRWDIAFARQALGITTVPLMVALVAYYTWRAITEKKLSDFILLGISAGVISYIYLPARFALLWSGLCFIFVIIKRPSYFKENWKGMTAALLIFMISFAPIAAGMMEKPGAYSSRVKRLSVFSQMNQDYLKSRGETTKTFLLKNTGYALQSFNVKSGTIFNYSYKGSPLVGFFGGIIVFLGFVYALVNIFRGKYFIMVFMFFLYLPAFIFSVGGEYGNLGTRLSNTIVLAAAFGGMALFRIFQTFREKGNKAKYLYIVMLVIFTGLYIYENYNTYFNLMHKAHYRTLPREAREAADRLKELGEGGFGYLLKENLGEKNFDFFIYPLQNYKMFDTSTSILEPKDSTKHLVFLLLEKYEPIMPVLKQIYPGGEVVRRLTEGEDKNHYGLWYEVSKEAVAEFNSSEKINGLREVFYSGSNWDGDKLQENIVPCVFVLSQIRYKYTFHSVRWLGKIKAEETGRYTFSIFSFSDLELYIDGKKVTSVAEINGRENRTNDGSIYLKKGLHEIEVKWKTERGNFFNATLMWSGPGIPEKEVVPYKSLYY